MAGIVIGGVAIAIALAKASKDSSTVRNSLSAPPQYCNCEQAECLQCHPKSTSLLAKFDRKILHSERRALKHEAKALRKADKTQRLLQGPPTAGERGLAEEMARPMQMEQGVDYKFGPSPVYH